MIEQVSLCEIAPELQLRKYQPSTEINHHGFNKIVAIGYDQNKSQRLPISRYSLKITIIGLGTTGLISGIGLAALGHKVIAVDHDECKVNALNQARVCSDDPKLKALVKQVRRLKNLVATCDLHNAILNSELTMICLANYCPPKATTEPDNMSLVIERVSATLRSKRNFHLIAVCQPTALSDSQNFMGSEIEKQTGKTLGKDFGLCFFPLVLSEEKGLSDFYSLPNMTITTSDAKSEDLAGKLFNGFEHKIKYVRYIKA
jgi:UDP-glucose 6-dehydrogenase